MVKVFLCLILVIGTITAQSCKWKNPFLPMLSQDGVMIFDKPSMTSTKCGTEWSTYGTCCDEKTLLQVIVQENKDIQEINSKLKDLLGKVKGKIGKFMNELSSLKTGLESSGGNSKALYLLNQLAAFQNYADGYIQNSTDLQDSCVANIIKVRGSAVCASCSGRGELFFKNGSLIISETTCRSLLGSCRVNWRTTVLIIDAISEINYLIAELKAAGKDIIHVPDTFAKAESLEKWINTFNIREYLDLCRPSTGNCQSAVASKGCESFVTTRNAPFIVNATQLLQDTYDGLDDWNGFGKDISKSLQKIVTSLNQRPVGDQDSILTWNSAKSSFMVKSKLSALQTYITNLLKSLGINVTYRRLLDGDSKDGKDNKPAPPAGPAAVPPKPATNPLPATPQQNEASPFTPPAAGGDTQVMPDNYKGADGTTPLSLSNSFP